MTPENAQEIARQIVPDVIVAAQDYHADRVESLIAAALMGAVKPLEAEAGRLKAVLELWDGIGFDFWLTDDEWRATEPNDDDERDWVNLSSLTRAALSAPAERLDRDEDTAKALDVVERDFAPAEPGAKEETK